LAIAVGLAFNIDPSIPVTPGDDFSFNLFRRSNTSEVEIGQNLKASLIVENDLSLSFKLKN
jgi:hypothetical protein